MDITSIPAILTKTEMNQFDKFVNSPFFNTEQRFIKLYDVIKSEGENLSRETIAVKMFNGKVSASDNSFRKLVSEFMKLFERFLGELEITEDRFRHKLALAKQLAKRGLASDYRREVKKVELIIEADNVKDENYFLQMLELYTYRYQIEDFNFNSWKDDLSFSINDILDKYFIAWKLLLFQRYLSIEYIFLPDKNLDKTFFETIEHYIKKNIVELKNEQPSIYLRHLMYSMIANPHEMDLASEYLAYLDKVEKNFKLNCKIYYEDLINYYTLLINLGKDEFESNIILVARIMDERGYFKSGISSNDYKIICEAVIDTEDFEWGENFAERNRDYMDDSSRESIYASCIAKINFFKKDYIKARKFISQVSYNDFMRYAESKLIECRILYEEKQIIDLLAVIETTHKYLKANKEIGTHFRETYLSFLNYIKRLSVLYEKSNLNKNIEFDLGKIEEEIVKRKSQLYGKSWLNEKIDELKRQV